MHVLNEFMFQSHMSRLTQWSAKRFYNSLSVYSLPLPLRKNSPLAAQLKIAFRRFLLPGPSRRLAPVMECKRFITGA